jgi:hypothetical protein
MMNPWFTISYQTARLGFEVQNAATLQFLRLVGGTSKTEVPDKIAAPPDVQADAVQVDAAPPDVQVAATKLASDRGTRRESTTPKQSLKRFLNWPKVANKIPSGSA